MNYYNIVVDVVLILELFSFSMLFNNDLLSYSTN